LTTSTRPDSLELADYLGVLRRRWWIALVLMGVGLLAAGVDLEVTPNTYSAGASVYVAATDNSQALGGTSSPVNMDNEAQIVQSQTVAELAARRLHSSLTPRDLVKRVGVTVPPNTTVLDINCNAATARRAAACANAFAAAYLSVRLASAVNTDQSAVTALQSKLNALAGTIGTLNAELSAPASNPARRVTARVELRGANAQLGALVSQLTLLVPQLTSLQAPNNALAGHVINAAVPPTSPSAPRALLLLPSGLLAGLIIGLLAAFFVDRRDERLHAPRDIERFLDLPVLVSLDAEQAGMRSGPASPASRVGQVFAELAREVAGALGEGSHVLLVAGVAPGTGAGVIAVNLATALARTRGEVVLVSAAPRGTVTPQLLGVGDGRGLAELLTGSATISDVARTAADVADLRVIGPGVDGAGALLHRRHDVSRSLMVELRSCAQCVVIEAEPAGDGSDVLILAEFADAAIVVIETSGTTRSDAIDCLRRLDRLGTTVLGAAVVPASASVGGLPSALPPAVPRPAPEQPNALAAQPVGSGGAQGRPLAAEGSPQPGATGGSEQGGSR
jgi:capsular polysaccharide biosynthesis protein